MKRRNSKAAKWWFIGDLLYYVGLLGAIIWILVGVGKAALLLLQEISNYQIWLYFLVVFVAILFFLVAIFFTGGCLKFVSYKIAIKEAINPADY